MIRAIVLLCCWWLPLAAAIDVSAADAAGRLAKARTAVAKHFGFAEGSTANRLTAAVLLHKAIIAADGSTATIDDKQFDRYKMIHGNWQAVVSAITASALPDETKDQLIRWHGALYVFPIRQSPPRIGVKALSQRFAAIPAGGTTITISDDAPLAEAIASHWPDWPKLSSIEHLLAYRALATLNPQLHELGCYRLVKDQPAYRRADVGSSLHDEQLLHLLYAIDPDLRLTPSGPAAMRGDELVLLNGGDPMVIRFNLPTGARIHLPPADWFAAVTRPPSLDLRDLGFADDRILQHQQPQRLDLRGNKLATCRFIAAIEGLSTLLLDHNPMADLRPLADSGITSLTLENTRISDLTPLAGLALERLELGHTPVADLSPLIGMTSLKHLELHHSLVTDLTPLAGLKLSYLRLDIHTAYAGLDQLQVSHINDTPIAAWLDDHRIAHGADPAVIAEKQAKEKKKKSQPKPKAKVETAPPKKKKKKNSKVDDELDSLLED